MQKAMMTVLRDVAPLTTLFVEVDRLKPGELRIMQSGQCVGTVGSVAGERVGSLLRSAASHISEVQAEVRGSRVSAQVPLEMSIFGRHGDPGGVRDAMDLWIRNQATSEESVVLGVKTAQEEKHGLLDALRAVTLRHVLVSPTEDILRPAPDSAPAEMPVPVLLLTLLYLSLADSCCLCMVSKKWNEAINGASYLWEPLVWWNATLYAGADGQTKPEAFLSGVDTFHALPARRRILAMLSKPTCCSACGTPLFKKNLTRAQKSAASIAESTKWLRNMRNICVGCVDAFALPLQAARVDYSEIPRGMWSKFESLKVDARKCFVVADVKRVARQVRYEALCSRALAAGNTVQVQWELENMANAAAKTGSGRASKARASAQAVAAADLFDEDEEEGRGDEDEDEAGDDDSGGASAAAYPSHNGVQREVSVPLNMVEFRADRPWHPDGVEVVVQRNIALLKELQLIEEVGRTDSHVSYVVTLGAPRNARAAEKPKPFGRRRKGNDDDDDEEFQLEEESNGKRAAARAAEEEEEDDDLEGEVEEVSEVVEPAVVEQPRKKTKTVSRAERKKEIEEQVKAERKALSQPAFNIPADRATLLEDEELKALLSRYGLDPQACSHPDVRTVVAKFDVPEGQEGESLLKFQKKDVVVVGYWSEERRWSVGYLQEDAFDYTRMRRKWGWIPNPYFAVASTWSGLDPTMAIKKIGEEDVSSSSISE